MLTARRQWLVGCGVSVSCAAAICGCGGDSPKPRTSARPATSTASARPPVAKLAAGGYAGYASLTDGHVWAWGDDMEAQLGHRTGRAGPFSTTPVEIPGLAHVVAVAGGANTAYALKRGGTVWAWGDDSEHELGDAGESPRHRPVRVRTPSGVVAIAAGMFAAYALRRDGTVWAWGENAVGQLGTSGSDTARGTPQRVQHLTGIVAIAAGAGDGYALARDGTVWAWGDGSLGQLGAGGCTATQAAALHSHCPAPGVPVRVRGLGGVAAIAAGANTGYALRRDGTVWAWGDGSFGALGGGAKRPSTRGPLRVSGLSHVHTIAAGSASAYAVVLDGTVRAWGRGIDGELGDGSFADSRIPRRVLGLTDAVQVAGGGAMGYALDRRGRLWAWGGGFYGQLGNGQRLDLDVPTQVLGLGPIAAPI
jgi:alpha-tubulin suppressor-like RCC1 family protein